MLYRLNDYEIKSDPYNRWISNPGKLLTTYLKIALQYNKNSNLRQANYYKISGSVVAFEINLEKNYVLLAVNYSLRSDNEIDLKKSV